MKSIYIAVIAALALGCGAAQTSTEREPAMILFCYEGNPRAHTPAVVWFVGKTIPSPMPDAENHDTFWKGRFDAAPKFSLDQNAYDEVGMLLRESLGTEKGPYVVEFLFESKRSVVRFVDAKNFKRLREAFQASDIKGREILTDWPFEAPPVEAGHQK